MHACFTLFILFVVYHQKKVMIMHEQRYLTKTDLLSCLRHPIGYTLFYVLKLPNDVKIAGR
jgi:hypothetical protein